MNLGRMVLRVKRAPLEEKRAHGQATGGTSKPERLSVAEPLAGQIMSSSPIRNGAPNAGLAQNQPWRAFFPEIPCPQTESLSLAQQQWERLPVWLWLSFRETSNCNTNNRNLDRITQYLAGNSCRGLTANGPVQKRTIIYIGFLACLASFPSDRVRRVTVLTDDFCHDHNWLTSIVQRRR